MAATDDRNDPYRSFNFEVDFGDQTIAGFTEVTGLNADGDAADYREGTDKVNSVRKLLGLRKYTNIQLKRGFTKNDRLWQWYASAANGRNDRRDGTITLLDEQRRAVLRWRVRGAWVNKIETGGFKANASEVLIETVELVHEGVTLEPVR